MARKLVVTTIAVGLLLPACGSGSRATSSGTIPCSSPAKVAATGNSRPQASFSTEVMAHGQVACIVGNGFGTTHGNVLFLGVFKDPPAAARIAAWRDTLIEVVVPDKSVTGPVEAYLATGEPFYVGPAFILGAPNRVARLTASPVDARPPFDAALVKLHATDASGRPVSGAVIALSDGLGGVSGTTDVAGNCAISIQPTQSTNLIAISGTAWTRVSVAVQTLPDERMTLTTSAEELIVGQAATLTAVVTTPDGAPVPNQEVDFSGNSRTAQFNPVKAITDSTGTAQTKVTSSVPGFVVLEADTNDYSTNAYAEAFWSTNIVSSISPSSGPAGTVVTIHGVGFGASAKAYFGPVAATSVTFVSSTTIRAIAPPGEGTVGVSVEVAGVSSDVTAAPQYTYR